MYRIGIDFGGTNIAVGLVDSNLKIVAKESRPTGKDTRSVDLMVADMADICRNLMNKAGIGFDQLESIGIASPGTINSATGEVECYHGMSLDHYPMVNILSGYLDGYKNIRIANDANAAALGEVMAGAAKGAKEAIMVTLGTGVGGGIIINGKIYEGFNFSAAEIGHIVIEKDGLECPCGRRGCWEQYSSATGLIRMTKEAMNQNKDSLLWKVCPEIDKVNGKTVFDGVELGDTTAKAVLDKYYSYLACGLANMVNIFQPEILCIGGGICGQGENLRAPIEKLVMEEQYAKTTAHKTKIVIASLGNDAGIIGAAML
jgi:glucokinase